MTALGAKLQSIYEDKKKAKEARSTTRGEAGKEERGEGHEGEEGKGLEGKGQEGDDGKGEEGEEETGQKGQVSNGQEGDDGQGGRARRTGRAMPREARRRLRSLLRLRRPGRWTRTGAPCRWGTQSYATPRSSRTSRRPTSSA